MPKARANTTSDPGSGAGTERSPVTVRLSPTPNTVMKLDTGAHGSVLLARKSVSAAAPFAVTVVGLLPCQMAVPLSTE